MHDTAKGLAEFLGVSVALIRKKSREPDFPKIKIGRSVRFSREDVVAWLKTQEPKGNGRGEDGCQ